MKGLSKTLLPFAVAAAIALWWIGALDWRAVNVNEPPRPETEPAPSADTARDNNEPSTESAVPSQDSWPTFHGQPALAGAVPVSLPNELTRLWTYQAKGPVYAPPVASADAIFFNTDDGWVGAIDEQGVEIWSRQLLRIPLSGGTPIPERFEAPLACFDSAVLLGASHGTLYSLSAATGETTWTFDVGGPVLGTVNMVKASSQLAADRLVVIDQDDGALQCLDAATGQPIWRTEEIDRCDGSPSVGDGVIVFGSCAAALHVFDANDGTLMKNIELDDESQVAGGVALVADSAFSGSQSGKLFHANVTSGAIIWVNEDSDAEVFTTPAVNENWVVFGSLDGNVYALNRESGKTMWTFETDGEPSSAVIVDDKVLFSSDGTLFLLRLETGEKLWSYNVSDTISGPALIWGMVVVGSDDGTVTAFR